MKSLKSIVKENLTESSRVTPKTVKEIERFAKEAKKLGDTVEINHKMPTIFINLSNGEEYFFQEWEAQELLDEVPDNVDPEEWFLWIAHGW